MMPNGIPRRADASFATSWPTRVILNAVFLIVSHKVSEISAADRLESRLYNARSGDADVDDRVCLCNTVECTCHERVVIRCIAENNKLRAA